MAKGTIIVTGSNGGIGSSIVSRITTSPSLSSYYGNYTVRDASSTPSSSTLQNHSLQASNNNNSSSSSSSKRSQETMSLELSNLASVREAAATINARVAAGEIPPIRALILNAGYQELDGQRFTEDGQFALTFPANYLGHCL